MQAERSVRMRSFPRFFPIKDWRTRRAGNIPSFLHVAMGNQFELGCGIAHIHRVRQANCVFNSSF